MTVTVTKPPINLREILNSLRRRIGLKGAEILKADTIEEVYSVIGTGRNKIINGGFDIWQRSIGPITGSGYTTADRWLLPDTSQTSQRVINDRSDANTRYALQASSNPSTGYNQIAQRIEDVSTFAGKVVTMSFWAKASIPGKFRVMCFQNFGSGGSSHVFVIESTSNSAQALIMNAANTWQRFTYTFQLPSVSGKTIGSASYIQVGVGGQHDYTTAHTFTLSEFQLEVGSVATPFEHRHYGTELALCQRYFYKIQPSSYTPFYVGWCDSATNFVGAVFLPTIMRATPTLGTTGAAGDYFVRYSGSQISTATVVPVLGNGTGAFQGPYRLDTGASGLTQGGGGMLVSSNSVGYLSFSAEL